MKRARQRSRSWLSRSRTGSPTCRPPSKRAWRSTPSRRGSRFFFNAHNDLFQEVAKYRAARRIWARIMTERFGARDEKSKRLRFHTQTGGSTLTAQQPDNNIVRVSAAGPFRRPRRHPEPSHEQLRRGDRAPDRARGQARAAHPAGHRLRVRRDRHRRPAGRFLFRRDRSPTRWSVPRLDYIARIDKLGGAVAAIEVGLHARRDRAGRL